MKLLLTLLLSINVLFALYLSDELPIEAVQLADSFECFSDDDKIVLYTYTLALKYRMEHLDDRDALVKSDLDYWRLWHLASDIEQACSLDYDFSDVLEAIITPTNKLKKRLKKLRRVEGSIHTDGSSESSERMRKYDEKLRKSILKSPPKYKLISKNEKLPDYDLGSLKKLPSNTIPNHIYSAIEKENVGEVEKNLLLRTAYLREEMLRKYDKPKQRYAMKQELIYLDQCQKYYDVYLQGDFYFNPKRKIASLGERFSHYYPLKKEFLPKEVKAYCENNITQTKIGAFDAKIIKPVKKPRKVIDFTKSKAFIASYQGTDDMKEKMKTYIDLVSKQLNSNGQNMVSGLQMIRLDECFKESDLEFVKNVTEDIEKSDLKDEFLEQVIKPQMWWMMTIKMKSDMEGETQELKHFFDCNQSNVNLSSFMTSQAKQEEKRSRFTEDDMRKAIMQQSEILKNYAGTFANKPTPELNNASAIKEGLLSKRMLDDKGKIKIFLGEKIEIKGMPKGGISLTYYGIPSGKICSKFVGTINMNNNIYFNSKSYDGLDYALINGQKVKTDYYVGSYTSRLCAGEDNNTVSFVKEEVLKEHQYRAKELDSAFGIAERIKTFDKNHYSPYSFENLPNSDRFVVIGGDAKIYDLGRREGYANITKLPSMLENSYDIAATADESLLAVHRYGNVVHIVDLTRNRWIRTVDLEDKKPGRLTFFLSDNKIIVFAGRNVVFYDSQSGKKVAEFTPKFLKGSKSFFGPRITALALSQDQKTLYVGSNRSMIERWSIDELDDIEYIDTIEDKAVREVGVMKVAPYDENILMVGAKGQAITFWDLRKKQKIDSYTTDTHMYCRDIQFSDDQKYMMAVGEGSVHIWEKGKKTPLEIIMGDKIVGGIFLPGSHELVTMGKDIDVWELK